MDKKKSLRLKQIGGGVFFALSAIGMIVCAIVDVAINRAFTWSLYPIVSIILACVLAFPVIHKGKNGILPMLCVLTVAIFPYLYALDTIAGTEGLMIKVGGVIACLVLLYLWLMYPIMKRCQNRKCMGFGVAMLLAAPLCADQLFTLLDTHSRGCRV